MLWESSELIHKPIKSNFLDPKLTFFALSTNGLILFYRIKMGIPFVVRHYSFKVDIEILTSQLLRIDIVSFH